MEALLSNIVPELLTSRQAAELCGIGERTLWRWSRSGIAPAPVRLAGRTIRFRRDELRAWTKAGCPRMGKWRWDEDEA